MEELTNILSNLSLSGNKSDFLAGVKPALSALTRADIATGIKDVDLVVLFDCLNTDSSEQIESCIEVLQYLLSFIDPQIVLQRYGELMRLGLEHSNPAVVVLIIKQVQRCARDEELSVSIASHPIYLPSLRLLNHEDLKVGAEVSELLQLMAEHPAGLKTLLDQRTVATLQQLATANDTMKIRGLDAVVKISQFSQEHLDAVDKAGLLMPLLSLLDVDDVLLKLVVVELFTSLAYTPQGLRYLEKNNVIIRIENILMEARNDPFADILVPGLLKFFGNIAHLRPKQMIVQHPKFMDYLLEMADSEDLTLKATSFETLGYIGVSLEGKSCLAGMGNKMLNCIEKLDNLIQDAPTDIRIRGMNAFASLIKLDKENQNSEYLTITESWYRSSLGSRTEPVSVLYSLVKQPFLDLRLAVYLLLFNMAKQGWGRREILRCPGFPELLLDRSAEREKSGKEAKYLLIQALVESGDAKDIVGDELEGALKLYTRQGPFYVKVESQLAFEDAN